MRIGGTAEKKRKAPAQRLGGHGAALAELDLTLKASIYGYCQREETPIHDLHGLSESADGVSNQEMSPASGDSFLSPQLFAVFQYGFQSIGATSEW